MAQSPKLMWSYDVQGAFGAALGVDATGNAYVSGTFSWTLETPEGTVHAIGDNAYLAKLSAEGLVEWIRTPTSPYAVGRGPVTVGDDGVVYVGGSFYREVYFGPDTLYADSTWMPFPANGYVYASPYFVAAYDPAGNVDWATSPFFSVFSAWPRHIVSHDSLLYLAGSVDGVLVFEDSARVENRNAFVTSYDSKGAHRRAFAIGGETFRHYREHVEALATDPDGNVIILASVMAADVAFADTVLSRPSTSWNYDKLLGKVSPDGRALWTRLFDVQELDTNGDVATDSEGNVYLTSVHTDTLRLDEETVLYPPPPPSVRRFFLAKYARDGKLVWVRNAVAESAGGYSEGVSVAVDPHDNVHVAGNFFGMVVMGEDTLSYANSSGFLRGYSPTGTLLYSLVLVDQTIEGLSKQLAVSADGHLFLLLRQRLQKFSLSDASTSTGSPSPPPGVMVQRYPDPSAGIVNFTYTLPFASGVQLRVFDLIGREVALVVDGFLSAGRHEVTFDANLASGFYVYRLEAGTHRASGTIALVR